MLRLPIGFTSWATAQRRRVEQWKRLLPFGEDETTKLPENTTREHWDTHTHTLMDGIQDEERHCFTSKFQMAVTIWTNKAPRRTAWRVLNALEGHGTTQSVHNTVAKSTYARWITRGSTLSSVRARRQHDLAQEQLTSSAQASFELLARLSKRRCFGGDSHLHATSVILCRRSGRTLACSVPCNSSADLLVGTTSPEHRMRNGTKSGMARSGETWSWQIW